MSGTAAALPVPSAPLVNQAGIVTPAWWFFFQRMFQRTGGGTGSTIGPPQTISPAASPFSFAPSTSGTLFISGGGVSLVLISRQGGPQYPVGLFYRPVPMQLGDMVVINFTWAPQITFFPG